MPLQGRTTSQMNDPEVTRLTTWSTSFLQPRGNTGTAQDTRYALIILNQPFSVELLRRLWDRCHWHCCADGGSNRLHDVFTSEEERQEHIPDLIKGDLDSIRDDVQDYYASKGAPVIKDGDQYSTDLMKCIFALEEKERTEGQAYSVVLLGGLSGRLDQTIHTLSYLHKLRKKRLRVFVATDDNVGWVLDEGEHQIEIDHFLLGRTCGLLPVGVESTVLSTKGLQWNLNEQVSSFDGLISTSNHLIPEEKVVWIKTSRPIWWCAELRRAALQ